MSSRFATYGRLTLAVLATTAALALPACYTMFEHARLAELEYARPADERCLECHSREMVWAYTHPTKAPGYADYKDPSWSQYYDVPWWLGWIWKNTGSYGPVPNGSGASTAVDTLRADSASAKPGAGEQ